MESKKISGTKAKKKEYVLKGYDAFSSEWYPLPGTYKNETEAEAAAHARLKDLEKNQSSSASGGQSGVQDQVYIDCPDGRRRRVVPAPRDDFVIELPSIEALMRAEPGFRARMENQRPDADYWVEKGRGIAESLASKHATGEATEDDLLCELEIGLELTEGHTWLVFDEMRKNGILRKTERGTYKVESKHSSEEPQQ